MAFTKTKLFNMALLGMVTMLSACGITTTGNATGGNQQSSNTTYSYSYAPLTKSDADQMFADQGYTVDMQLVDADGLGNSSGIADINNIYMYRATNGDLFLAYDVVTNSYSDSLYNVSNPSTWDGSSDVRLYIDSDNNVSTGSVIKTIGADTKLTETQQFYWDVTGQNWVSTWYDGTSSSTSHTIDWSYSVLTTDLSSNAYERVTKRFPYLSTLNLNPSAMAVLQIASDSAAILDTSTAFSIGQL